MPFLNANDGCRLYYEVRGQGKQVILLVPGLGGDGRFWDHVATLLEPHFKLLIVDHRGAGRCDRPHQSDYSIAQIADDILQILDFTGLQHVHAVGHSTGGAVVQALALDSPGRINRLVISASWDHADERFRALFGVRLALLEHDLTDQYQAMTQVLGYDAAYLEDHSQRLQVERSVAKTRLEPLAVTCARIRMLLEFDRRNDLPRLQAPTLVIGATDDIMVPFYNSQALAAAIPGARLATMLGGHFYPLSASDKLADLILEHLQVP